MASKAFLLGYKNTLTKYAATLPELWGRIRDRASETADDVGSFVRENAPSRQEIGDAVRRGGSVVGDTVGGAIRGAGNLVGNGLRRVGDAVDGPYDDWAYDAEDLVRNTSDNIADRATTAVQGAGDTVGNTIAGTTPEEDWLYGDDDALWEDAGDTQPGAYFDPDDGAVSDGVGDAQQPKPITFQDRIRELMGNVPPGAFDKGNIDKGTDENPFKPDWYRRPPDTIKDRFAREKEVNRDTPPVDREKYLRSIQKETLPAKPSPSFEDGFKSIIDRYSLPRGIRPTQPGEPTPPSGQQFPGYRRTPDRYPQPRAITTPNPVFNPGPAEQQKYGL